MNNIQRIYELIAAHFAGETDKDQDEVLRDWICLSADNKQVFEETIAIWMVGMADYKQMEKSKVAVLGRVLRRARKRRFLRPAVAVATIAIALVLGFTLANLTLDQEGKNKSIKGMLQGEVTMITLPGQKSQVTLPDGTNVWLNSQTTFSYPVSYGIEERTATLVEGEIFLDVAKKEGQLFTLNMPNGIIKVYGTSFDAKNYSKDELMTVSLDEGLIEFSSNDETVKTVITPGQKLVLDKESGSMMIQEFDIGSGSVWRYGELIIDKKSFYEVMADMEFWYGVEINVTGKPPQDTYYWMTIKSESLREMLGLLQKITPLTYDIKGKHVNINLK